MRNDTYLRKNGFHVVTAGGTIDFQPNPNYERDSHRVDLLIPRENSIVPYFLRDRVRMQNDIVFSRACMKDSRELNAKDREKILDEARKSQYKKILITHGIVEMDKTVDYLKNHQNHLKGKTVAVVGSRMPLSDYRSDGGYQLGYAIGELQKSKNGVHKFHPDDTKTKTEEKLNNTIFLFTGGTIDSHFSEYADTAIPYNSSIIPEYFRNTLGVIPAESEVFNEICMKDSRQLTETEIHKLLQTSQDKGHKNQIITAGTYALPDLASRFEFMRSRKDLANSKYIFVGSMLPDDVYLNDGWFNIGFALAKMDSIDPSVNVAMHGWVTPPGNVLKQLQEARFKLYDESIQK